MLTGALSRKAKACLHGLVTLLTTAACKRLTAGSNLLLVSARSIRGTLDRERRAAAQAFLVRHARGRGASQGRMVRHSPTGRAARPASRSALCPALTARLLAWLSAWPLCSANCLASPKLPAPLPAWPPAKLLAQLLDCHVLRRFQPGELQVLGDGKGGVRGAVVPAVWLGNHDLVGARPDGRVVGVSW